MDTDQLSFYSPVDLDFIMTDLQKQYSNAAWLELQYQGGLVPFEALVDQPMPYYQQADAYLSAAAYGSPGLFEPMPTAQLLTSVATPVASLDGGSMDGLDLNASPVLSAVHDDNTSVATGFTPSPSPVPIPMPITVPGSATPVVETISTADDPSRQHSRQQRSQQQQKAKDSKPTRQRKQTAETLPYAPNMISLNLNLSRRTHRTKSSGTSPTRPSVPFRCDYPGCDKTFTRPYNLKSHRRTHTAERPFDCSYCPKRFARQHDRNRHAKLHLGIKPYVCCYCQKAFARHDALNRHQHMNATADSATPPCAKSAKNKMH